MHRADSCNVFVDKHDRVVSSYEGRQYITQPPKRKHIPFASAMKNVENRKRLIRRMSLEGTKAEAQIKLSYENITRFFDKILLWTPRGTPVYRAINGGYGRRDGPGGDGAVHGNLKKVG